MMIFDSSFGIDFRQNHLLLTYLRKSFGKIRLVDYSIHPLAPEGQREEREAQVIRLINSFVAQHQVNKQRACVSIPREKVVFRFIRLPITTKENLRRVMEYETSKYTPFERGEVYFDYAILKEEKDWLYLYVVFVKKIEVDACLSLLKKVGIQPISIQIPSTAALNLFFYNEGAKEGELSVLLDVTEPFFEMNILQGKDWKESLHLSLPSEHREASIIGTFKRSGLKSDSVSKPSFFVFGLDATEKLLPSLREANEIKGAFVPPLHRIEVGKGISRPDRIFSSIGVSLRGLTKPYLDLNLLPFELRKKTRQIGKPLLVVLTLLALILGFTWGIGVFARDRTVLNAINAEVKKRKPGVEAVERLQKQKEELEKEMAELKKIETGEISKIEILKELVQLLPSTVWIWNLKYANREVEINGFAESASDLIPLLDKSPLFERVEFGAPVTRERLSRGPRVAQAPPDKEMERFKIKMRLEARRAGT